VRDKLRALAKVAEIDEASSSYDQELKTIPAKLAAMREDVATLEKLLEHERAQLDEAKALLAERTQELSERREAVTRAKSKGSRAQTMKEADMAEREVESNRRAAAEREKEISQIQDTIEAKATTLAERESQFEEARQILETEEKEGKARLEVVKVERDKVLVGRGKYVELVPPRIIKRYERLRERSKHKAVTILTSEMCSSCRLLLPAQFYIELLRFDDIRDCPQCRAFLVHERALEGYVPPNPDGPSAEA
jgi:hypothetical protein